MQIEADGRRRVRALGLGLPLALVLAAGSAAAAKPGDAGIDLPISRVVLYGSGVGSFELRGTARGDEKASLSFNVQRINDILKSLVVLDLDGGQPGAIVYDSQEPIGHRLASFGVDISDNPSIPRLLGRLVGSGVRVRTTESPVEGAILGVEERTVPSKVADSEATKQMFVNLMTKGGIRSLQISELQSLEFLDESISSELNKALAALAENRAAQNKSVSLSLRGPGDEPRRIVVTYTHEMPVWKSTYRLVLPQEAAPDAESQAGVLQGWAIVENTTDADWTDIRLSLASGRPVSFTMDLYTPLFVDRPDVPVPFFAAAGPRVYEGAFQNAALGRGALGKARGDLEMDAFAESAPASAASGMADRLSMQIQQQDIIESAARAAARAVSEGRQFVYTLEAPVSIERKTSAMLPIISDQVKGRRVSIFSTASQELHPMRGFEFTSDGANLMPGPISVYDGGTYAGDAQIPHTSAGQERLLSYAVDLDVTVRAEPSETQTLAKLRFVDGLLEQTYAQRQTTVYTAKSRDKEHPRTLIIDHPRRSGWKLIEPAKPAEETVSVHRFEMELPPDQSGTLTVVAEYTSATSVALTDFDTPVILELAQSGAGSPKVAEALKKLAEIRSRAAALARSVQQVEQERASIEQDQSRLRSNMNSIDRTSELYRRYLAKLAEQETAMEGIRERFDSLIKQQVAADEEFRAAVAGLNLD